jgi:hypothetical protein
VVAILRGDPLALEEAERVRARRPHPQPLRAGGRADVAAQRRQLAHHVAGRAAHGRCDLEHRLHQLAGDPGLELVPLHRRQHRVDVLDEVERGRVEEHVLLLDAERVRLAATEAVVVDAALVARGEPGDGGRHGLRRRLGLERRRGGGLDAHGRTASASIPTSPRGSSTLATIAREKPATAS